jgi:hypothetical protein
MRFVLLILAAFQAATATPPPATPPAPAAAPVAAPATVRGDRFQIAVPQGWKVLTSDADVLLEHTSGASLLIVRVEATRNLSDYAQQQAERIMAPLGFAKLSEPRDYKDAHDEWVEYEIRGTRQADPRRILYRALHHGTAFYGVVYEASDDQYEALLTDAQSIAASVQNLIESAPARRRRAPAAKK